jgi:hypothetical protein
VNPPFLDQPIDDPRTHTCDLHRLFERNQRSSFFALRTQDLTRPARFSEQIQLALFDRRFRSLLPYHLSALEARAIPAHSVAGNGILGHYRVLSFIASANVLVYNRPGIEIPTGSPAN